MATKKYPISQSPIYKLKTKKKLAKLLEVSINDLFDLQSDDNYKVFKKDDREIQEPKGRLRRVHDKIQEYFSRINTPDYLFSGVKGKSSVVNANYHRYSSYMIKMDIKGFYKTSKKEYVKRMFLHKFKCNPDIAHILSEIICYKDIIPTGSPLSQNIAFWSHWEIFNTISKIAKSQKILFTLYVDDMTFSSESKIPLSFIGKINKILKIEELKLKNKKTIKYGKNDYKVVTGCIISPNYLLLVLNKHKEKVINLLSEKNNKSKKSSLLGLISYCRTIEPNFMNTTENEIRLK